MSNANTSKAKSSWTDKERLTYLFALIDVSAVKFNYQSAPRPAGRSLIACQRMVERLRGTLKDELEALKGGVAVTEDAGKGVEKKGGVARKRKGTSDEGGQVPRKRGRKGKGGVEGKVQNDGNENEDEEVEVNVKDEMTDDELD
ncbi:hypothetical protein ACN47E_008619 [Coniothyrium glycines]